MRTAHSTKLIIQDQLDAIQVMAEVDSNAKCCASQWMRPFISYILEFWLPISIIKQNRLFAKGHSLPVENFRARKPMGGKAIWIFMYTWADMCG